VEVRVEVVHGSTGSGGNGSGMVPVQRLLPGMAAVHVVWATTVGVARHVWFCALYISQKNDEDPRVTSFCVMALRASVVRGSWSP
jgi:hypothetical protein